MKFRYVFAGRLTVVCLALGGLAFAVTVEAQQPDPRGAFDRGEQPAPAARPAAGLPGLSGAGGFPGGGVAQPGGRIGSGGGGGARKAKSNHEKLQYAIGQLKKAEGEVRKKTLETISELVNVIFDEDMKRRTAEVDDIRNRVKRLKALIDRRKASKDRIVGLQLKVQINEVEGLGFSVRQNSRSRRSFQNAGGMSDMSMSMMMGGAGGGAFDSSRTKQMMASGFGATKPATPDPRVKAGKALGAAIAKLKSAKKAEDRKAAAKELKPALEAYFAADLKVREQEIEGIQKRVENLDALIERRRKARDEIISLQLEVLANEADGLGFFSTSVQSRQGTYGWIYGGEFLKPVRVDQPSVDLTRSERCWLRVSIAGSSSLAAVP